MKWLSMLVTLYFIAGVSGAYTQNPLEEAEWVKFFNDRAYEEKVKMVTDESFWEIDATYTYYTSYPLLLIYSDGVAVEIEWQYDGLNNLIYKKHTLLDANFERYEKANIAYMVFDGWLLKNGMVENMIDGDFMFVYKKGPISVYREYYTSPVERNNIESALTVYHLSEPVDNFYLGSFEKKAAKLVADFPDLAAKIKDRIIGYRNSEDDLLRIAGEYNEWVKQKYPYRYEDHTWMFWQSRFK